MNQKGVPTHPQPVQLSCSLLSGRFDHGLEALGVPDRHVGQHLAIETDVSLFQVVDEPAVSCPVLARSGVYAGNP